MISWHLKTSPASINMLLANTVKDRKGWIHSWLIWAYRWEGILLFANLQPLNTIQRVPEQSVWRGESRGREGRRKGRKGREEKKKDRARDSCCIFTQTWSVLPLCHSTTWPELCGRLHHTAIKRHQTGAFLFTPRVRWSPTAPLAASVSYHRVYSFRWHLHFVNVTHLAA